MIDFLPINDHYIKIFLLKLTIFSPCSAIIENTVYFVAPHWGNIFDFTSSGNRDNSFGPLCQLKSALEKQGLKAQLIHDPQQAKDPYKVIWFDIPPALIAKTTVIPHEKQLLFIWEPRVINPQSYQKNLHKHFASVYTWDDQLLTKSSSTHKYNKFFYPQLRIPIDSSPPYEERKLLTMINRYATCRAPGELKSKRIDAVQFFEKKIPNHFDLYGKHWPKNLFPSYQGEIAAKEMVIPSYRFVLCFENTDVQWGYVSEKILDAFYCRCVPIYLGAPNVETYIPKECFIDMREYKTYESLLTRISEMSKEEWQGYLDAAAKFCSSTAGTKFSAQNFVKTVLQALQYVSQANQRI